MRSFKLALGFMLTATAAAAQTYPSPTYSGVNVTAGGTYKINGASVLGLSGSNPVIPGLPGLSTSVQSTGIPGLDNIPSGWMLYANPTSPTTNNPSDVFRVQRYANYTGGTVGNVYTGAHVYHTVAAGVANYEWSFLAALDNYATGGENTAVYGQALKRTGAGPTWASVFEARDKASTVNPTTALVASEMDVIGNGTDTNRQKIGINLVCGRENLSGADQHCGYGIWMTPSNSDTHSIWDRAIGFSGNLGIGFDATGGTFSTAPVFLSQTQKIVLDGTTSGTYARSLFYDTGSLVWSTPSGNVFKVTDSGDITAASVNIPTGASYSINNVPLLALSGTSAVISAPVISDFAYPGLNVTKDMYRVNTGSFPFNDEYAGVGNTVSSIVGLINIPAGTVTGAHIFDSGVSGYAQTSNTLRDAIGLYGEGAILVNGASAYGLNTEVINCENHSTTNCGYGKGKNMGQLWSIEADVSIYKVGSAAPTGDVAGVVAVAYTETQPTGQFNAFQVVQNTDITGSQPWKTGLTIGDATASTAAIVVGASAHYTSSAVGSMPMYFMTYNSGGTQVPVSIYADATANLQVTSGVNIPTGASYKVNNVAGVSCAAGTVNLATLVVTGGIITHC